MTDVIFHDHAWEQYLYWQTEDRRVLRKLNELIRDCQRSPYSGLGKPEPLKDQLSGWWSRRITDEHRLVYRLAGGSIEIAQWRWHYQR